MKIDPQPRHVAGLCYLLWFIGLLAMWMILLFSHNPTDVTPMSVLRYTLSEENPNQGYFWISIASGLLSLGVSIALLASRQFSLLRLVLLSLLGLLHTALEVTYFAVDWALIALIPLLFLAAELREKLAGPVSSE